MKRALALACLLVSSAPSWAVSPYDLFFRSESDAMLLGGGDVPGEITGRPEVDRPASLLETGRPVVRLDLCSQTPVQLTDDTGTLGRWHSDSVKLTLVQPVDERWAVGLQVETVDDSIWYDNAQSGYRIDAATDEYTVAGAYRISEDWTAAAGWTWGSLDASGRGEAVTDMLDLPADNPRWPTLSIDQHSFTLAASHRGDRFQGGALIGWSDPDATLRVTRDVYDYSAPMDSGTDWYEVWGGYRDGSDQWWAGLRDMQSDGSGSIFLGAGGRGDTSLNLSDQTFSVGWREETKRTITQAQIDWREADFATYEQGYAGLLPGISTDIYTFRGGGRTAVQSVRLGHQRALADCWSWAAAGGAHFADVNGRTVLKRITGIGSNPVVESESTVDDGTVQLWSLTLGLVYEREDLRVALTGTGGYAETNDAFDDAFTYGGDGPDEGGTSLEVEPLFTLGVEWHL
ncbi:MAG: hypothetical protein ACOCZ7_05140 [Armatimonadota bacterium]